MNNTGELKQRSGRQVRARSIDCGQDPVGDRGDPKLKRRLHRTEEESKKVSRSVGQSEGGRERRRERTGVRLAYWQQGQSAQSSQQQQSPQQSQQGVGALSWSVILFVVFAGFGLVLLGRVVSLVLLSSSPV